MRNNYDGCRWVVQRNLTSKDDYSALKIACETIGIHFIGIDIIPFTTELPVIDHSRNSIIYGSTTFNNLAMADDVLCNGVFFDEQTFCISNYIEKWGRFMLNYNATISTFQALMGSNLASDKLLFIRPDDDSKSFSGDVKSFGEISEWFNSLKQVENTNLSANSKIIVSEPYNIQYEWRLWIVDKKVVASSKYREYFKLKKERGCPADVITFAENRCTEYTPHEIFVMDVCLSGDDYYIVECGCMNAAGFYKANIGLIVKAVTDHFIATSK